MNKIKNAFACTVFAAVLATTAVSCQKSENTEAQPEKKELPGATLTTLKESVALQFGTDVDNVFYNEIKDEFIASVIIPGDTKPSLFVVSKKEAQNSYELFNKDKSQN